MERMLARLGGDPEYDTREFSPLGEVSLYGCSPVLQVWIQLINMLLSVCSEAVESIIVKLENSRTLILILPPSSN